MDKESENKLGKPFAPFKDANELQAHIHIIRHYKENKKKCSLSGLENHPFLKFYTFPLKKPFPVKHGLILSFEGPIISKKDALSPLILLDGTWRYSERMFKQIPEIQAFEKRSLPKGFKSAYPRRQEDCLDPSRGLASVEALSVACALMGLSWLDLLNAYYWKESFLEKNHDLLFPFF